MVSKRLLSLQFMLSTLLYTIIGGFIFILVVFFTALNSTEAIAMPFREVRALGVLFSLLSLWLIGLALQPQIRSHTSSSRQMLLILLAGIAIRLFFTFFTTGSFDVRSYEIVTGIMAEGGNVYAETSRYNYSPVWFLILRLLDLLPLGATMVKVRLFLTLIDCLIFVVLIRIARQQQLPEVTVAISFFLCPISFLLTSIHGQFENLTILFILLGIFAFYKFTTRGKWGLLLGTTIALIIKHNVFYIAITAVNFCFRRWWLKFALLGTSALLFLLTFLPYWAEGRDGIINNVFLYNSVAGYYGITTIINHPALRYLFSLGLIVYPFLTRSEDLLTRCLQAFLFFLVFTPGLGVQYFLLPLAVGCLRISRGFVVYLFLTSLYLMGDGANLAAPPFNFLPLNLVWFGAIFWLVWLHWQTRQASRGD